jgi:hypothetical protein
MLDCAEKISNNFLPFDGWLQNDCAALKSFFPVGKIARHNFVNPPLLHACGARSAMRACFFCSSVAFFKICRCTLMAVFGLSLKSGSIKGLERCRQETLFITAMFHFP